MIKLICMWLCLATCIQVLSVYAEEPRLQAADVQEIAQGIYVRAGQSGTIFQDRDIANIGFIVGKQCVAVIDTGGSLEEGKALRLAIKKQTSLPVCYVINTHVHPDHILGNHAFINPETRFIGHSNLARAMQLLGPTYLQRASVSMTTTLPPGHIVLPDETVKQDLRIDLGGRNLLLQARPQAHTDNDLTVFDEKTRTRWLGDLLFADHIPVIGGSGSLRGWLKLLEGLQKEPAALVVPGHGPVSMSWPDAAVNEIRYLKSLRDETRLWLQQDGELPEALENIGNTEKEKWQQFNEFHKRNISTAYTELEWEE